MIKEYRKKTLPDGRVIQHRDIIHHTVTTKFSWKDRWRIFFGKPVIIMSEIYTDHEDAKVLGSEAGAMVPRIFPKKTKPVTLSQEELQAAYKKLKGETNEK